MVTLTYLNVLVVFRLHCDADNFVVRLDERTGNLFILAGREETIEFEANSQGEIVNEQI